MRWLLFLSRLGFICGVFLLLAFSLQIRKWVPEQSIASTIFIIGYFMGIFIIPSVNLCYLVVLVIRKQLSPVPLWLSLANVLFLFIQLFFILFLNIHIAG
ncbi:MAG: hypothetical protein QM764_18865 [Chitinophagaceae bacterium]